MSQGCVLTAHPHILTAHAQWPASMHMPCGLNVHTGHQTNWLAVQKYVLFTVSYKLWPVCKACRQSAAWYLCYARQGLPR
jgi:hypothetical protein